MLRQTRRTSRPVDFGLGAVAAPLRPPIKTETRWNLLPHSNLIKEHMGTASKCFVEEEIGFVDPRSVIGLITP